MHRYFERKYDALTAQFLLDSNYELIEQLGMGGYGVAYLVEHKETKVHYVLKRLRRKHRKSEKNKKKFFLEIEILRKLQHVPVPQVIEEGFIADVPFYIMTYIQGDTFEQRIFRDGAKYSIVDCLNIIEQLMHIVSEIHAQQIVHRDLRIPNVIIQGQELAVIDFGLAVELHHDADMKIKNPKKLQTPASDLYFLGHFLLFLLYSDYESTERKERSWQQELDLPQQVTAFLERLLTIRPPFQTLDDALQELALVKKVIKSEV
ncbi:serine/threonine protein kinase [Solibacillus sp. FSL H8-0538]|uniref:serine/threonine protein kinase n=1 Tax=Solibacillus sp. FSL H8-0538 TaxID=2921400 RepID=UPI0030FCC94A